VDGGKGGGEQILTVFERRLSENIRQLEFRKILEPQNVKRIVEEADGYQPHLIAPEMGYRRLLQARARGRPRPPRARRAPGDERPGSGGAACGGRSGRRPALEACADGADGVRGIRGAGVSHWVGLPCGHPGALPEHQGSC